MSSEWPLKRLSEVADFHNHRRVPLKSLDRQKRQGKYPYYGASGVVDHIDDYIFDGVFLLVSEDGENLRTRKTPIAFKTSGKFWVNNHAHILQEKEEGVLDYLEYYFSILDLTPFITGAVQPKLNKANLETIEIPVPPKDERLKINQVLNSFTNKIELNTQINQTLEQIAQALFKSWFVDFDPVKAKIAVLEAGGTAEAAELAAMGTIAAKSPEQLADMQQSQPEAYQQLTQTAALFPAAMQNSELGQIPKGWKVDALGSINYAKGGYAFKSKDFSETGNPVIKIKNILSTGEIDTKACQCINNEKVKIASQFKLNNGDLLIAMTGATVGKSGIYVSDGRNAYLNQRVARLQSKIEKKYNCWFTYHLINLTSTFNQIISTAQGSAQANISSKDIELAPAMIPSHELIKLFNKYTSPMYRNWIANLQHKLLLAGFRDTLLPKLLSGAIDLAHINKSSPSNL